MLTINRSINTQTTTDVEELRLPIPELFTLRKRYSYQQPQQSIAYDYDTIERGYKRSRIDNDLMFDVDGGDALNWYMGATPEDFNTVNEENYSAYREVVEGESVPYFDQGQVRHYCQAMDGAVVSSCEPLEVMGGQYVYIDWVECCKYWKQNLPQETLSRINWNELNPDNFIVCADSTVKKI